MTFVSLTFITFNLITKNNNKGLLLFSFLERFRMKNPADREDAESHRDNFPSTDGRDEMNLAEYPIALLADRAPKDVKTLVYKDKDQTLTITGSDLLGLPT